MNNNPNDKPSSKAQFEYLSRAEERNSISQKIKFLEGQVSANRNKIAELTKASQTLSRANRDLTSYKEEIAHVSQNLDQAKEKLADASSQLAALTSDLDKSKK